MNVTDSIKLRPEDIAQLQELRLMDDDFMKLAFDDNKEATALLLNIIFDRYDMEVLQVTSQQEIKSIGGRSVRFDIYAIDSEGRLTHYLCQRSIQRQYHTYRQIEIQKLKESL